MPMNDNARNKAVDGIAGAVTHVSYHTAIPDATGSAEVTGGTYARQAVAWAASSVGLKSNSGALSTPIPAATTVYATGKWSALTVGTFYGSDLIGSTKKGSGPAVATTDTITSYGHGLANTNRIIVQALVGQTLPAGLSATVVYFVVGATTDTFQVSLTSGGAAVDITANGHLYWQDLIPETYASAGTATVAVSALVLDASGL